MVSYDAATRFPLLGYSLSESFLLSLGAGALAGLSGIAACLLNRITLTRIIVPAAAAAAGVLAILSPTYSLTVKVPGLGVNATIEAGMFAAMFSGIAMLGAGIMALIVSLTTRIERHAPYMGYQPAAYEPPQYQYPEISETTGEEYVERASMMEEATLEEPTHEEAPQGEVTSYAPAGDAAIGSQCAICYDQLTRDTAVRCTTCGTLFHRDCADISRELGGQCPGCGLRFT